MTSADFACLKFQVGILYDEVSLQNVLDLTADWTPEERQLLRNKVMLNRTRQSPFFNVNESIKHFLHWSFLCMHEFKFALFKLYARDYVCL